MGLVKARSSWVWKEWYPWEGGPPSCTAPVLRLTLLSGYQIWKPGDPEGTHDAKRMGGPVGMGGILGGGAQTYPTCL